MGEENQTEAADATHEPVAAIEPSEPVETLEIAAEEATDASFVDQTGEDDQSFFDDLPPTEPTIVDPRYSGMAAELREAMPYNKEIMTLVGLLLKKCGVDVKRFLEIGCGDAILAQIVLKTFPKASGVLLDVDEPSLTTAWERLGDESTRMAFVAQDVTDNEWAESVTNVAPFDLILSSFVIDQQNDEHKVDVYSDIFDLLGPGGIFLNLDYVSIAAPFARKVYDDLYIESLIAFRQTTGKTADAAEAEANYLNRPDKPFLLPSQTDAQCDWLREIGFVGVDCFFRSLGVALFGGAKPLKVSSSRDE